MQLYCVHVPLSDTQELDGVFVLGIFVVTLFVLTVFPAALT